MDITVEVMLPPRGATDFSESANPTYRVLAPVAVYVPRRDIRAVHQNATGYLHVTDVPQIIPDEVTTRIHFESENEKITAQLNARLCDTWTEISAVHMERTEVTIEKRRWCGDPSGLTIREANTLLAERQITITWDHFCEILKRREPYEGQRPVTSTDIDAR